MKTITHMNPRRGNETLHIETAGCIVNIRVGLHNKEGQGVTNITVLPDRYIGEEWDLDGNTGVIRVIERKKAKV